MIFVDSSVWIALLRDLPTRQVEVLDWLLDHEPVVVGDLVIAEVLQGCDDRAAFTRALQLLTTIPQVVDVGGQDIAVAAAHNYRALRERGITVRKTIDTLIATRCIIDGYELLHADRDFDGFARHLGLRVVPVAAVS